VSKEDWETLFLDLYYSPSEAITELEVLGHRSCMGEMINARRILVQYPGVVSLNGRVM
jgi:hypothetical protein